MAGAIEDRKLRPVTLRATLFLFFLVNLVLLVCLADRDGFEGDDLNSILPMAHLDAAKNGLLLIYRYEWQPLAYETGAAIWSVLGTPTAVFLMAPVAGALTIALLCAALWREVRGNARSLAVAIAMLCIPELWFSSLYYNSTIVGMPLFALAFLLVRRGDSEAACVLAGLLAGLAILMRLDFILACPLLAMAAWKPGQRFGRPFALAAAVAATLGLALVTGFLNPDRILEIQMMSAAEIANKAQQPGWDLRMKLGVASVSLSPVGWLILIAGGGALMVNAARQGDWRALLWLGAALPACYPILNILSPKYLLPAAPFLLLLFVNALALYGRPARRQRMTAAGLMAVALVPLIFSLSLTGKVPFLIPGFAPEKPVPTHDGPRGYGGYIWQMLAARTSMSEGEQAKLDKAKLMESALLNSRRGTLALIGGENFFNPGAVGWRHLQLLLERRGVRGKLIAPHRLRFDLGEGQRLILSTSPLPSGMADRVIDLRSPDGAAPDL